MFKYQCHLIIMVMDVVRLHQDRANKALGVFLSIKFIELQGFPKIELQQVQNID